MQVPFVDLKAQYKSIKTEVNQAISNVLENCNFILGQEVEEFEKNFAKFIGIDYAIGVSNGLDALKIALEVLGIGYKDEVIIPANTFIATALAVSAVGAKPVLVDINTKTYNIDTSLIEDAITAQTKAIMPVHLYGQAADMKAIIDIAKKHNLEIVEDAAQSHGSHYNGFSTGTFGKIGCFSLYPGKNLGAYGDAGIIVTADKNLAAKISRLRNYGQKQKYYHSEKGLNNRLDTLQAAVLNVKLKYLTEWNSKRAYNAKLYSEYLSDLEEVKTPQIALDRDHIFHLYVVRVKEREKLQKFLLEKGITTIIHYPVPIHLQEAYSDLGYQKGAFPITEAFAEEIVSLPMFPELSQEQIQYTCSMIKEFYS
ncbi:MAG: DegT/DnrJ/EryC1/StrS family aminotransferase [Acidobacteria bacterium]|nr:DegT/DnrJ/EryC1/StrS family aminotransferase [Acidobacteriota bacterium]